jgi:hypothetical protein
MPESTFRCYCGKDHPLKTLGRSVNHETGELINPDAHKEYRVTFMCLYFRDGHCQTCRREQSPDAWPVDHPDGPFSTEAEAKAYAYGMKLKVFGFEHQTFIQERDVSKWKDMGA